MRSLLHLACLAIALGACACSEASKPAPVQQPVVTDTRPLGDGLKVIGFAFLGASVVITLGRLLR
jgi:hypothetical protein